MVNKGILLKREIPMLELTYNQKETNLGLGQLSGGCKRGLGGVNMNLAKY